jgi:arylsulfatase A
MITRAEFKEACEKAFNMMEAAGIYLAVICIFTIMQKLIRKAMPGILIIVLAFGCKQQNSQKTLLEKPNILIMIADDMGYADLGCYGGASNTPNLDQLARSGILFTDFYAAAPNCSPSRSGLLTGRAPSRTGIYNYRPPNHPMHLRDEEITIAEVLKDAGYQTSHFGKWHLGALPYDSILQHPQPSEQGFDYSFGTENNVVPSHLNPVNFVRNGVRLDTLKGYSCQIVADEAISWLTDLYDRSDPFFMYVAFHEPHAKVASPPELVEKYKEYPPFDAEYLANIENLDSAAGRIIRYLEINKYLENTLVLFCSDNGSYRQASNGNLRAVKSYLYEGGIRVPGIVHWPELIKHGKVINQPAGFVDVMPTICDILGIDPLNDRAIDGTSILGLFKGEDFTRENPLFWFFYRTSPEIALRIGNHMVMGRDMDTVPRTHRFSEPDMIYIKNMQLQEYELYNLKGDIYQDYNMIESHPDAGTFIKLLDDKLMEIQEEGYSWKELPAASGRKRIKTDWVRYTRRPVQLNQ